jgi:hypothetical protein
MAVSTALRPVVSLTLDREGVVAILPRVAPALVELA